MELLGISEKIEKSIRINKINENEIKIEANIFFSDNTKFEVYLMQDKKGNKILTDKRRTLNYMNDFYDLKSDDVQASIASVLDLYDIKIYHNALVYKIKETDDIETVYFEFISCIGQLINMFVFFDKPKDDD